MVHKQVLSAGREGTIITGGGSVPPGHPGRWDRRAEGGRNKADAGGGSHGRRLGLGTSRTVLDDEWSEK